MMMRPRYIAIATFLSALVIYVLTLAPSVDFIDAGELAAVTHTLGIAHPTGYPLFTMAGWIWSHVPLGDEIVRMNLFSAILCAAAAAILSTVIHFILVRLRITRAARKPAPREKKRASRAKEKRAQAAEQVPPLAAVFGALTVAFSETFWSTALSIEVYALHALLVVSTTAFFLKALYAPEDETASFVSREKYWLFFAFFLGLSFTNHMTTLLLAPGCLYLFFARYRFSRRSARKIGIAVPAFLLGLAPYVYLPLRAAAQPALNWGNPATWERILWHVSGKQYRVWIFSSTESARKQLSFFLESFPAEFGYVILPLVLIGIVVSFRLRKELGYFLLLLFLGCVFYSINYDIHDIESYFLLAYIVSGIYAAIGFSWLVRRVGWSLPLSGGIAAICVASLLFLGFRGVSQRGNYLVEDYTMNMFRSLKPNAVILSFQWDYFVSASYYYQKVRGERPDVVVIDKELLRRSWYFEQLRNNHPEIFERSRREIEEFLPELAKFEHDMPYDPTVIETKFNRMVNSIIDRNISDRPVYLTVEMEEQFGGNYLRVPEGLAFRLYRTNPPLEAGESEEFFFRPFDRTGRLIDGIKSMYTTMLVSRARYLSTQARFTRALIYIDRALKIDPTSGDVLRWQGMIRESMRQTEGR